MSGSPVRTVARWGRALAFAASGAPDRARRILAERDAVLVLTFHRILADPEFNKSSSLPGILVRRRTFAALLDHLQDHYEIVDLAQPVAFGNAKRDRLRVAITFDDGWHDNWTDALPETHRRGIPFTVFVCPGLMDTWQPFWPERVCARWKQAETGGEARRSFERALGGLRWRSLSELIELLKAMPPREREKVLGELGAGAGSAPDAAEPECRTIAWEEARKMASGRVTIASHTMTHPILTQIAPEQVLPELSDSRRVVAEQIGSKCRMLAYPNGNVDGTVREVAAQAGYELAFTTQTGPWVAETDTLRIPRFNMCETGLVGPGGRFSAAMFEHAVVRRAAA